MINFKIFDINFAVSVGFTGIICLMLYVDKVGLMFPITLAVFLHETGHLIALFVFKAKPQRIELKAGAIAIMGNFALTFGEQLVMLTAGSGFNLLIFVTLYCFYSFYKTAYLLNFSLVMLVIGILNFLPILGLDGGEILRLLLLKFLKVKVANTIVFVASLITVFIVILLGFYILTDTKSNISLIIFGIYLFLSILMSKKKKNDCKIR